MKKYKFTVKKILKNDIEIKAENKQKAIEQILELLGIGDEIIFENIQKDNKFYEIKIDKIINLENEKNYQKEYDKAKKLIKEILSKEDKKCEELNEIEDDLLEEYNEIVCEKCGNCILIDEDMLS